MLGEQPVADTRASPNVLRERNHEERKSLSKIKTKAIRRLKSALGKSLFISRNQWN